MSPRGPTVGRWSALVPAIAAAIALAVMPAPAQITVTPAVFVAYVNHQVDVGFGDERTSGPVLGADIRVAPTSWTEVTITGYAGTLTPDSGNFDTRRMSDIELSGSVFATPWLAFQLEARARSYTTTLARQRWLSLTVGGELREPMFDGAVQAVLRVGLLPAVDVSGLPSPNFAGTAGAGFQFLRAPLTGSVIFSFERYDFPTTSNGPRSEQVAMVTAQLGVRFPR
jgi:hypothetical protein